MSDDPSYGFGRFVPGFDFLQNIAKGTSQSTPQMPNLANWVAPTLNVEELEKRISELKAVHFWLDQNSKALGATIQALEVQKMTLATLKGMNLSMNELANSLKMKTADTVAGGMQKVADAAETVAGGAKSGAKSGGEGKAKAAAKGNGEAAAAGPIDPLQWWGALTQQFQEIAAGALKDATHQTALDAARNMTTGGAQEAVKAASGAVKAPGRKQAARKTKAA